MVSTISFVVALTLESTHSFNQKVENVWTVILSAEIQNATEVVLLFKKYNKTDTGIYSC